MKLEARRVGLHRPARQAHPPGSGPWPDLLRIGLALLSTIMLAIVVAALAPEELAWLTFRGGQPCLPIGIGLQVLGRGIELVEESD